MIHQISKKYYPKQKNELSPTCFAADILTDHPKTISDHLEWAWSVSNHPDNFRKKIRPKLPGLTHKETVANRNCNLDYPHLIYAYMMENTRMVQIFRKVLLAYRNGEELSSPSAATQLWLRNTEMLFFRHLPGFYTYSLRSEIRPDPEAMRRNAYYRMFGMELGHGDLQDKKYIFHRAKHANKDFSRVVRELLAEIYRAVINRSNTSGTDSTDYASISKLSLSLKRMLQERRRGGNLSQEEFNAVAMMSWFDYTLKKEGFALFKDIGAEAESPEGRLIKIGQKVGLPANTKSGSFIDLAPEFSHWLILIEDGLFDDVKKAEKAMADDDFRQQMTQVITDWSIATGVDIKKSEAGTSSLQLA